MKKLEEKIINKIYKMETRKTVNQIISEVVAIITITLSAVFIFSIIIEVLNDQTSFALFDFLRDDFEIIKTNFFDNSLLFIQELPLPLTYILISLLLLLVWLLFIFIKNFNKIKNKIVSIYKFWLK
jgi:hypothetical protein